MIVRGKYAARYAGNWIGCHRAGCGRWLHKKCVSEIDLINMSEEDFENFYFSMYLLLIDYAQNSICVNMLIFPFFKFCDFCDYFLFVVV